MLGDLPARAIRAWSDIQINFDALAHSKPVAPTFAANWINYATGFAPAMLHVYRDLVIVEGLVCKTVVPGGGTETIFSFPRQYAPVASIIFGGFSSIGVLRLDVQRPAAGPGLLAVSAAAGMGAGAAGGAPFLSVACAWRAAG